MIFIKIFSIFTYFFQITKSVFGTGFVIFFLISCTRNTNNLLPRGGYCGLSTQDFKNPYSTENLDSEVFLILEDLLSGADDQTTDPVKYRAQTVSLLFKKGQAVSSSDGEGPYVPDEQVMFLHVPVYLSDNVSLAGFNTTCKRGLTLESEGSFAAVLPTEISLNKDLTWTSNQSLEYSVSYGAQFTEEGFLVGSVEPTSDPGSAGSADFDFVDLVFLEQIGKLSKIQKDMKASLDTKLDEIFMQVQVSADPEVFARITFLKVKEIAASDLD